MAVLDDILDPEDNEDEDKLYSGITMDRGVTDFDQEVEEMLKFAKNREGRWD